MFPNSDITKQNGCARTKTANIKTLALDNEQGFTEAMKRCPFSLATNGSTDMEHVKM
jgi:hypothetical protein